MRVPRRPRWRAGLLCVAVLATSSIVVTGAQTAAAPGCQDASIVFARGSVKPADAPGLAPWSGETYAFFHEVNVALGKGDYFGNVVQLGDKNNDGVLDSDGYPAVGGTNWVAFQLGDGTWQYPGYSQSVLIGTNELVNHLNARAIQCPNEAEVVGGFSQGGDLVGWALERNGSDGYPALSPEARRNIAYAAVYGDPKLDPGNPADRQIGAKPWWVQGNSPGFQYTDDFVAVPLDGLLGPRLPYYAPTDFVGKFGSWCDQHDQVCNGTGILGGSHTTTYTNYWIEQSANTIANAARAKIAELNPPIPPAPPPAPVPPAFHNGATIATGSFFGIQIAFWKGGDGHLWETWYSGGQWNGPVSYPQFGILHSNPTLAVNPWTGSQHIFWKSGGGSLMQAWWDGSWHGPQDLGMGPLGSAPAATAWGAHINVYWKGMDGHLWQGWWNGTTWNGPQKLGMGPLGSAPSAAANLNGEQYVFWRGTNGLLTAGWYTGGIWNGPGILNNMGILGSAPTVAVRPINGEQDVFWKGMDGNLWQAYFANGVWHGPQPFLNMGTLGSTPAVTAWLTEVDVFWVSNGGGVLMEAYYQNGIWHGPTALGMSVIPVQP